MPRVKGDSHSKLLIASNSLARDFSGNCGDEPYQVVFRPGLILNLSEMYEFINVSNPSGGKIMKVLEDVKDFLKDKTGCTVIVQVCWQISSQI